MRTASRFHKVASATSSLPSRVNTALHSPNQPPPLMVLQPAPPVTHMLPPLMMLHSRLKTLSTLQLLPGVSLASRHTSTHVVFPSHNLARKTSSLPLSVSTDTRLLLDGPHGHLIPGLSRTSRNTSPHPETKPLRRLLHKRTLPVSNSSRLLKLHTQRHPRVVELLTHLLPHT